MRGRPPGWRPVFRLPFRARDVQRDVDEEIAFHLAMRAERMRARGLEAGDAERVAHHRFGDLDAVRSECIAIDYDLARRQRAADYRGDLMNDFVFAVRGLRRAPGFAVTALLSLALGIGAATAIFSIAYGVLFRPMFFPNPDRLVEIGIKPEATGAYGSLSAPEYADLGRTTQAVSSIWAWTSSDRTIGGDGKPERITAASVTASVFETLGVRAALGRVFTREEDVVNGPRVVVLTDGLWRRRYGADADIIGKHVDIDAIPRSVIGVLPPGVGLRRAQAFTPMGLDPTHLPGRCAHFLRVIGRLRASTTLEQAQAEMVAFSRRTSQEQAANYGKRGFAATAHSLREAWFGNARPMMNALLVTVVLLLLLAAVNVANLLLVRAEARQRELGVRAALGASRSRLVRQLLTESLILASLGAVVGVPLAAQALRSLFVFFFGVVFLGVVFLVVFCVFVFF